MQLNRSFKKKNCFQDQCLAVLNREDNKLVN